MDNIDTLNEALRKLPPERSKEVLRATLARSEAERVLLVLQGAVFGLLLGIAVSALVVAVMT